MNPLAFDATFETLFGNPPFPWQRSLYEHFVRGDFPSPCNLPTGLGKTAVIPIWLIALATAPQCVPRRLVYVVNRRTVVDQATREAEKVRDNLAQLPDLRAALARLCVTDEEPLAISTLRGQLAESNAWRMDPTRPAILVGTVDLIGSRLLFQGYRAGFKSRPMYAGFLGQDALVVHDEAHLEPAFQVLLEAIQSEQVGSGGFCRFAVVELSATSRSAGEPFTLSAEDHANAVVQKRLDAKKAIVIHEAVDRTKLADRLVELAKEHEPSRQAVLVFARSVEDVKKIQKKLPADRTRILTGTMRGKERDDLVTDSIFARFLPSADRGTVTLAEGTVYLACTSAGEVGVNISADHLVCDLSPFDSMAQRFGRVNRFGERDETRIDIVPPSELDAEDDYDQRRQRTLTLLRQLEGDGSPAALGRLEPQERLAAFSPQPTILPTTDMLFDAWALTTIRDDLPGRPEVVDYLHGLTGSEPPRTQVAWRREVWLLRDPETLKKFDLTDLLEDYPLKPHELLSDRTDRVAKELSALKAGPSTPVWLVSPRGKVTAHTLADLPGLREDLPNATVVLPPEAGGLEKGFLAGDVGPSDTMDCDVADMEDENELPIRVRLLVSVARPAGLRLIRTLDLRSTLPDSAEEENLGLVWRWYIQPWTGDDDSSRDSVDEQLLGDHLVQVGKLAGSYAERLNLGPALTHALDLAGRWHDLGKDRAVWQRYIENHNYPDKKLAKSNGRTRSKLEERYRHEFGSLLDLMALPEFQALGAHEQDLVLHLVAAHHGRARPHFPQEEAFDPSCHDDAHQASVALEVPRRFARLQRKYGRWGLAFLESLLRAADARASACPEKGSNT